MNNSRGFSAIEIFIFLLVLLLLCWCSLCDNPLNNAQAQKISGPVFAPDQGLPHGRLLQKKDHDKAVRGDTVLMAPKAITLSLGNGKYLATLGGSAKRVIQKGDTLRIAQYKPQGERSGIFEQVIDEDMVTRASDEAPNYKVSSEGKYIQFLFMGGTDPARLNATTGNGWRWDYNNYAVEIAVSTGVVKETLIAESGAPAEFWWAIDTNEPKTSNGYGRFIIPKVTAYDANDDTVLVTEKYSWDNGWKFTINVDTNGAAFPITIDPTVVDSTKGVSGRDGYLHALNVTYLTARNQTNNVNAVATTAGRVGQATNFDIYRSFWKFSLDGIPGNVTVTACTLYLNLQTGQNYGTYNIHLYAAWDSAYSTWLKTANGFNKFRGWAASGTYGTDTLTTSVRSSSLTNDYNAFVFNASALDTVESQKDFDDTLRLATISNKDREADDPTGDEYGIFDTSQDIGTEPYISIAYTTVSLSCSLSVGNAYDSLRVHVYGADTSLVDSIKAFKISGTDTLALTGKSAKFSYLWVDTADANVNYRILARWYDGATDSGNTNIDTIYSRPDTATMTLTINGADTVYIDPAVGANNSPNTKISILDSTEAIAVGHRVWFTLAGDTSITERFYTNAAWATVTKGWGLVNGDWQIVAVRAQNDDSTFKSSFNIDSIQTRIVFDSAYFVAIDTNRVQTQIGFPTFGAGDSIFVRIWDKVTNDTVKTDSFAYVSTLVRDTLTLPDSLNKKYGAYAFLKDTLGAIYTSDADSFRTYSVKPATVSWTWANDTSGVLVATKHSTMPNNSGYFLVDSTFVSAGSTQVYLHPDSLGYFATKTYRSITSFNDTIKFPDADLITGASIKFSLHAGNVDSTGAQ